MTRRGRRLRAVAVLACGPLLFLGVTLTVPMKVKTVKTYDAVGTEGPNLDGHAPCTEMYVTAFGASVYHVGSPGWLLVDRDRRYQSVTGEVMQSHVAAGDFMPAHYSHDQNADIRMDPGQEWLASVVNEPEGEAEGEAAGDGGEAGREHGGPADTIHIEWEIGTFPNEVRRNSPERFYPKWAWVSPGDRAWVNGNWIFDCGHPDSRRRYYTEIHPMRGSAAMRPLIMPFPDQSSSPVRVVQTDVYLHPEGGLATDILNCGIELMLEGEKDFRCPEHLNPIGENFEFDIELPPKPGPHARLVTTVEEQPGNTVRVEPVLTAQPAEDPTKLHVLLPLADAGVTETAVYARRIRAGWDEALRERVRHFRLTLAEMRLHKSMDPPLAHCNCSFFWVNVNRGSNRQWIRVVDFADGNMDSYYADTGAGGWFHDGIMRFSGAEFDIYLADGDSVAIQAEGYDQDCIDSQFNDRRFRTSKMAECYTVWPNGENDRFKKLSDVFGAAELTSGRRILSAGGQYDLVFDIEELQS